MLFCYPNSPLSQLTKTVIPVWIVVDIVVIFFSERFFPFERIPEQSYALPQISFLLFGKCVIHFAFHVQSEPKIL